MNSNPNKYKFEIIKTSTKSNARAGVLHTPHGKINTPVFMPVGTQASVKSMTPEMLNQVNAEIILSNTYHLALRPGIETIKNFNGLHEFMNWDKPILTDSGGFQVFSLSKFRSITPEGVTFNSHLNGNKHHFSPKSVIDLQMSFKSDIMMPLDICTAYPSTEKATKSDLDITHSWEKEAINYWKKLNTNQWLFSIVQGGMFPNLRKESAGFLSELDFPGHAIGGLSVGEPFHLFEDILGYTAELLPKNKPKYVMGIGLPDNLSFAISQGIDMFDCVMPTRIARHGQVFTTSGRVNIRIAKHKNDTSPIMSDCQCYTCQNYSKAYLRHLFVSKELLSHTLLSIHNIHFLIQFVRNIRQSILEE